MSVYGIHGVGKSSVATFSIKYAMDRHFFEDGAFYIDLGERLTTHGILTAISKKIQLITHEQDELFEMMRNLKILLMFDHSSKVIKQNRKNFMAILHSMISTTQFVKIIMINDHEINFT